MTTPLEARYKQRLLIERARLIEQLSSLRGGVVSRAQASAEHFGQPEDSPAQVSTARDLEFALDERETTELRALDAALGRIEAGSYGRCIDCGNAIPAARLDAAAQAPRCLACQDNVEQQG